jgi:hypothetical protein
MGDISKELADALEALANDIDIETAPLEPSTMTFQRRKAAAARIRSMNPPKKRKPPPPNVPWDTGLF